ncbi:MAG: hypothetical protein LQ341_002728 [Variospora aurantia]|nr:MAG: hypothetical protein LQ341_002728 [Variospora aurantia]
MVSPERLSCDNNEPPATNDVVMMQPIPAGVRDNVNVDSVSTACDGPSDHAEPSKHLTRQRKGLVMVALCSTMFVVSLDTFITTTAVPTIALDYDISDSGYAWIGSAYLLAFGSMVPVWANVSQVFGRRIILTITNLFFFAGVLTASFSQSAAVLITGRAIQGIGGGGLTVLVNMCVGDMFSIKDRTVPFIGLSFVLLIFLVKIETNTSPFLQGMKRIDWLGNLTVVGATTLLLVGLQLGGTTHPWNSTLVICLLTFGVMTYGIFGFLEWKVALVPLLPLRFFKRRSLLAILGVNISQSVITTGCTYFLPLYFQLGLGLSPLISGVYFLPTTLTLAMFFLCVGHIIRRNGHVVAIIRIGTVILTIGAGILVDSKPYTSWPRIIFAQLLLAGGLGMTYQAPLIAFHAQIDPADVAMGTSTFQYLKTLAQTVSIILGQVIFQNQMQHHAGSLMSGGIPLQLVSMLSKGATVSSAHGIQLLAETQQVAVRSAFVDALNDVWVFYTAVAFLGVLVSAFIKRTQME